MIDLFQKSTSLFAAISLALMFCFSCIGLDAQTAVMAADTLRFQGRSGSFLSIASDTNSVVVGTKTLRPLVLKVDSLERLHISTAGFVGIGSSSPTQLLEVKNGNLLISNSNGTPGELRVQSTTQKYVALRVDTLSANVTYIFPKTLPSSNGSVLTTDTSGRLSWNSNSGSSSVGNTVHGSFTSNQSGEWVVPSGVSQVNVVFKGTVGGKGGDADGPYNRWYGGAGGAPAFFSFTANVSAGDTIEYVHGANGVDGVSILGGWQGFIRNAGNGTAGGQSSLSVDGSLILTMTGGSGGTGACGGCGNNGYHGNPGAAGTLTLNDFNNSGILFYTKEDVLSINPATVLIRY
jgi:hypothetical protein